MDEKTSRVSETLPIRVGFFGRPLCRSWTYPTGQLVPVNIVVNNFEYIVPNDNRHGSARIATTILLANPAVEQQCLHCCVSAWRRHAVIHTGVRRWQCSQCPKTFLHQSSIYTHKLVHTGEKPYVCQICSKAFTQSGSLQTHVKYVHMKLKPPPRRRRADWKPALHP
ncbi:hypothetical protein MSG28_016131 [Choristoneura fumiferana]|uniref:Uncharacterized protein n=1 Tax=Choristoneura fumiferana TaxID=7141 RepID=A0ACC0K5H3_CHOFU|nr:hypothetical protein MSG28_016131 [Choristoneura fumiferana]